MTNEITRINRAEIAKEFKGIILAHKYTLEELIGPAMEKARHRNLIMLWGCLFSLVVADGIITQFLINQGLAWELNPFLVDLVGKSGFLALKSVGAGLAILILMNVSSRHYRLALGFTCFFVSMYTIIVYWNILVFFMGS